MYSMARRDSLAPLAQGPRLTETLSSSATTAENSKGLTRILSPQNTTALAYLEIMYWRS